MFLIAIEVEDTLDKVLEEHVWIPGQENVNQAELSYISEKM